jgi:hypothetical protein
VVIGCNESWAGVAMDMNRIGGNNHRAEMQELRRVMTALNKMEADRLEVDAEERILFKAGEHEHDTKCFVIDPTNRPEVKRGKGKVKRW